MKILSDQYGRKFEYLRLSITDACNFRCQYCLPHGYKKTCEEDPLNYSEIINLVSAFAELGTWKVRLTGGEPTLRKDLIEIIAGIKNISGVKKIAISTNGSKLVALAPLLKKAGVSALNVSLDSLDCKTFDALTGTSRGSEVLEGILETMKHSFDTIKINSVLLKKSSLAEFDRFEEWVKTNPISVRFIELMPTGSTPEFFKENHVSSATVRIELQKRGWKVCDRKPGDGPAEEWAHPTALGKLGIIAPYGPEFCSTCNRLRVSARGELRLCLFAEGNTSVRRLLKDPDQREELKETLCTLVYGKDRTHYLPEGRYGNNFTFSAIGG